MSGPIETEVLIVGAGPVGLFTALSLTSRGVDVKIVDEEFRTAAHSYAVAVHPRSLELLDELGAATDILAQGYRVETVAFYDGPNKCGGVRLSELDCKFPFVLVLPQSALEGLLERQLRKKGVKVEWNHRVTHLQADEAHATAAVDRLTKASCGYAVATTEWITEKTTQVGAAFVVGADGHRSVVRRALGTEYTAVGPTESFAVFEFETSADLAGEVRIVLAEDTTSVLWPLPNSRCRWSFQRQQTGASEEPRMKHRLTVPIGRQAVPQIPPEGLGELIHTRAPWFSWGVRNIDWSMEVRFERRLAGSYGQDRLWLAGDAAHLTGPVGGQSVNMGFREAAELSSRLTGILRDAAPLSSLADYNTQFLTQWRQLLAVDGGLAPTEDAPEWARTRCSRILPCIPATGDDLSSLAAQIGLGVVPAVKS
ncbi:MAG: FAD-dependent oxidoreductase [Planctomycetota bacterium]|jgi:2-polyprenyl-6-methoxyphenol hydroxylase-like FAD-dependent oxidoreductase